jgi:hypothetical protein
MKPPTFEAILGALAVLAVGAGCSKAEKAAPAPEATQPASSAGAAATAGAAAPAEPGPTPAATAPAPELRPSEAAVDAGREVGGPGAMKRKTPTAACGAAGCSPDMKK